MSSPIQGKFNGPTDAERAAMLRAYRQLSDQKRNAIMSRSRFQNDLGRSVGKRQRQKLVNAYAARARHNMMRIHQQIW